MTLTIDANVLTILIITSGVVYAIWRSTWPKKSSD